MPTVEERLAALERQQSIQTEAIARTVEGKWTGAEGAAGKVVELMGPAAIAARGFDPIQPPKD